MLSKQEKVSVIIPTYNSHHTILYAVRGLDAQSRKDLIEEIIVVDSSDHNETKDLLSTINNDLIRVIHSGVKVIPAKSRKYWSR